MVDTVFQALRYRRVGLGKFVFSARKKLAYVSPEVTEKLAALFVHVISVLDFSVQLFQKITKLFIIHSEAPLSEDEIFSS